MTPKQYIQALHELQKPLVAQQKRVEAVAKQHGFGSYQYKQEFEKEAKMIVNHFDGWYYHNSAFHIGNLLATMVKNGQAVRVRVGVYAPGKSFIPNVRRGSSPKVSEIVDGNQTSLF